MNKIAELRRDGFCILKAHLRASSIEACRQAFWPLLADYLQRHAAEPNRGPYRHFLPMPFIPPCFNPEFFFDPEILHIINSVLGERIVADQWGCDVPLKGSQNQVVHADFQRPLFAEAPDLLLPPYMLVVCFGLVAITPEHGPVEIAPGTHLLPRDQATRDVQSGMIRMQSVPLQIGDVLIRHPWALHRGTPNTTDEPRALVTIRFVRRWYWDSSREINPIPQSVWQTLAPRQQDLMRFAIED